MISGEQRGSFPPLFRRWHATIVQGDRAGEASRSNSSRWTSAVALPFVRQWRSSSAERARPSPSSVRPTATTSVAGMGLLVRLDGNAAGHRRAISRRSSPTDASYHQRLRLGDVDVVKAASGLRRQGKVSAGDFSFSLVDGSVDGTRGSSGLHFPTFLTSSSKAASNGSSPFRRHGARRRSSKQSNCGPSSPAWLRSQQWWRVAMATGSPPTGPFITAASMTFDSHSPSPTVSLVATLGSPFPYFSDVEQQGSEQRFFPFPATWCSAAIVEAEQLRTFLPGMASVAAMVEGSDGDGITTNGTFHHSSKHDLRLSFSFPDGFPRCNGCAAGGSNGRR
nr:hypothetical protein Iba_chr01aCG16600 [Ipomoea batatas]